MRLYTKMLWGLNARKRIFPMKEKNNLTSGTRGLFSAINLSPIFLSSTLSFLEVKATRQLRPDNFNQTLNYLKTSQVKLGILINFGEDKLNFRRIICSY